MDKTDKPTWMKNFEDSYSSPFFPGYWNKPLNGGGKGEANGGYRLANGGRGGHSETSSLYSRYTSSSSDRSERKRSRRLGLCIALTIVAFIIAALIGLLVYFLFMADRPRSRGVSGVDGSVRVLNMTYDDEMANTSSQAFRDVAVPFCAELDSYILSSNYSDRYEGCEVIALRNVADVTDCLCLGAKKGNVMVNFHLRLNGSHDEDELKKDIHGIIENSVTKLKFDDVIYVLLKHFLVDIRFDWNMLYNAIEADVTLPVYNLNYSQDLNNNQTGAFLSLSRPFCLDVDRILTNEKLSWLAPRYTSCRVTGFAEQSPDKGTVSFTLKFDGRDPRPLQQGLLYILLSGARNVEWHGQRLKMIGTLVITPFGASNHLRPVNVTGPPTNLTYVTVTLPVFNLTLTPELGDPRSPYFINITTEFCDSIARFYSQSSLKDRYYSCKVLGFRPNDTRIEFKVGFKDDPWSGLEGSVVVVIRAYAPDRFYATLHLYTVGRLDVILDQIAANGLEMHTSLRVVNLTYISALEDSGSAEFLHHAVLFCSDLEKFYQESIYADRLVQCGVKAFTPKPVKVHFFLVFKGTAMNGLTSSHVHVIRRHAKQVYLNSGWLAYLVGDLLVLPEHQSHSLYPTNITSTHIPTATPTIEVSTSTVFPTGAFTKATVTGGLYNFTFDVVLLDPGSARFKSVEKHFCDDVSRVYQNSFLFLTYRGCKIEHFRPSPDEVTFSLYFDARISRELEWGITYVLTNDSPKVNLTLNNNRLVEVLHLGDLYLTLREIVLEPTPSTSFPVHSATDVSPTPTMTVMTSTLPPSVTSTIDYVTSTIVNPTGTKVTLRYPLFNFTYLPGLGDPTSETFEQYQRRLCLEIQEVFKASRTFYLVYDGCGVNIFGFDQHGFPYVDFHLLFNTGFTDLLFRTTVETLETSRDHTTATVNLTRVLEILPIGGLQLILDNRTVSSSTIMSSMTQTVVSPDVSTVVSTSTLYTSITYGGVKVALTYETYELGYTDDLQDPNSPRFLAHRQKVCSDLERWYRGMDSPFYITYHGCELDSFSSSPENVTFSLTLRTDATPDLSRYVRTFLEHKAPTRLVLGYNLMRVGDLDLIMDRYNIEIIPIPLPSDSYTIFTSMTSTLDPTPTSSSVMPSSSIDYFINVSLRFGLADFVFSDELYYLNSQRFQSLQNAFCADMERFYQNSRLSPYYGGCQIVQFLESPPIYPHNVTFTLKMKMPDDEALVDETIATLLSQNPKIIIDGYVTIKVGDLYLILRGWVRVSPPDASPTSRQPTRTLSSTYTDTPTPTTLTPTIRPTASSSPPMSSTSVIVTTPPTTTPDPTYYFHMSFEVINMTWHPDLNVSTSERFMRHSRLFCDRLNEFLPGPEDKDFKHMIGCKIDNFGGEPLRVNFSLQFDTLEGLDLDRIQGLVITLITEHAIRHTVQDLMVLQIGDILIDIDTVHINNLTGITTINVFDAIAFEFQYMLAPGNFSFSLLDKSSYEFKTRSFEFCKDIDSIFEAVGIRNIRQRYLSCHVDQFSYLPYPSVNFTLVFDGVQLIDPARLNGIIVFSKQTDGVTFFTIGDLLVDKTDDVEQYFLMLDMISTHAYPYTTTPTPAVYTYVDIKLRVLSPSWTDELSDPSSAYYQEMVQAFCADVSRWIKQVKPDYLGCEVLRFGNNPMTIEAHLRFLGEQPASLRMDVDTILLESPDWEDFGNIFGLRIGHFFIYEESLQVLDPRTAPANSTTTPSISSTTSTTTPTPTKPSNPCLLGGSFHRHPTLCDRFVQCVDDVPIEIPCGPGSVYLDMVCMQPTPGFECTPLPG